MTVDDQASFSDASSVDAPTMASSETSVSPVASPKMNTKRTSPPSISLGLEDLYSENAAAKIWRVAESYLTLNPSLETYPEYVPTTGEGAGTYHSKPATFWTCGFFPASLYCVLERAIRFPQSLPRPPASAVSPEEFHAQLLSLCRSWSAPIHKNATRTNSHDLGFIMRSLRNDWELTGNPASLRSYITAAENLATRYDERLGAVRSWDRAVSKSYNIIDREKNFLIIVDSMCNMDLLFYAAHHSSNPRLSEIASAHSRTVLRTLVRPDYSTWHVANLNPLNPGEVLFQMTHQGYSDDSTWSRGQAWAVLGFAQTYRWTKDPLFLDAATRLADRFLDRLGETAPPAAGRHTHRNVPKWDFDAPATEDGGIDDEGQPLRDTSAGLIAANGLLLLHQSLQGANPFGGGDTRYLEAALAIARDTLGYSLDRSDAARFEVGADGRVAVAAGSWDAILRHSTANNNRNAMVRYGDHGLVYADYYFLEFGNQLLRMGLV